jgi:hypothetical protein
MKQVHNAHTLSSLFWDTIWTAHMWLQCALTTFPYGFCHEPHNDKYCGESFYIPCWMKSMSCVISDQVITVCPSRSTLNVWPPRFCFAAVYIPQSFDDSTDITAVSSGSLVTKLHVMQTQFLTDLHVGIYVHGNAIFLISVTVFRNVGY